jgi:hypothetical protein
MFNRDWDDVTTWHFAIAGLQTTADRLEFRDGVELVRLKTLPTRTELTGHLKNSLVAGVMQRYCGEKTVQHELVINAELADDSIPINEHADHILAGLRIRTQAEILCPAVCDRSWADLREAEPNSCLAELMESAMYSHQFDSPTAISDDDLKWIENNLPTLMALEEDERFTTALDALSTYLHAARYRMMAAQLWAGIESIFQAQAETSYSMSLWAALLLENRGTSCRERRKEIRKLYNDRSTAVHGGSIQEAELKTHVAAARGLLAQLLSRILELGRMPTHEDFHDLTTMPDDFQRRPLITPN